MEIIIIVIMLLTCFNFALKQTFCKSWTTYLMAALCALFIVLTYESATEQSKSQIADWIADRTLMLNTSVVLSAEVMLQMAYCIMAVHLQNSREVSRRTLFIYRLLRFYPGILIFPVLFHLETVAMFTLTGTEFQTIAYTLAAIILMSVPASMWFVRWLIPERPLRLELLFLSNAMIAILGVIATTNGTTAVAGISEVNLPALLFMVGLVLSFAVIGLIIYKIKSRKL